MAKTSAKPAPKKRTGTAIAKAKPIRKVAAKKVVAKKAAVKKSSSPKPDMPKLLDIFRRIKTLMKPYEPPFNARVDIEGRYDLWIEKTIRAFNREYDAMHFAAIIIQSGYVGFYYMPVYGEPEKLKKILGQNLMKLLKGKACFHVKELDAVLEAQIKQALQVGYKVYKERGWV